MKIWNMTKKDLTVFFRDRSALVWLFILPAVFILIFAGLAGQALNESDQSQEDTRITLVVVNEDQDGALVDRVISGLERDGGYRVELSSLDQAEQRLNKIKIIFYVIIPEGFSADLADGKQTKLTMITHPNGNQNQIIALAKAVNGVASDVSLELQLLDGIRQMGAMQAANPEAQQVFNTDRILAQAKYQFERSYQSPLVVIVPREPEEVVKTEDVDLNKTFVPGITVLFVFLSAQSVARNIFEEKRIGTFRRLLSAPLSRSDILVGKMVPILILTLIQIAFIFTVGAFLLPVFGFGRLGIGEDPLAWAVASFIIALCASSLGLFISSVARTEGQVSGLSNALLWVAGFLGGAIMPAFLYRTIPVLNFVAHLVPQYYAVSAYSDILARGKTLVDILPYLAVILGFTALFFIIGVRRFRFE
jgi:linearmycin/streptolysin S transport system permease protein